MRQGAEIKLSIDIYDLKRRFGDEKAFEMIKKAGFDAVDYSYYWLGDMEYDGDVTFEIFKYLAKFDDEIMPAALELAERVGRYLITKINKG